MNVDKIKELLLSKDFNETRLGLAMCPQDDYKELVEMFMGTRLLAPVVHYFYKVYAYKEYPGLRHT